MNFLVILGASLVSLPLGFIWYHKKVFGYAWMKAIGVTDEEKMKEGANMGLIFGLTILFSVMFSTILFTMVIHQSGIYSILQGIEIGDKPVIELNVNGQTIDWMNRFRTFKHGMLHGFLLSMFFVLPIIGTNALFERRGFKYIAITTGYWMVNLMIMGGIICAWA